VRIRCPKCSSINEYPDDMGWRKTECPVCSHGFIATKKLAVEPPAPPGDRDDGPANADGDAQPALQLVARRAGADTARIVAVVVAGAAVLAAGLMARAWLVARQDLGGLQEKLSELSALARSGAAEEGWPRTETGGGGPSSPNDASAVPGGSSEAASVKEKLVADRVLVTLQEAVLEKMQARAEELAARIKVLETKVKRGENALRREKGAHGKTKQKSARLLKDNAALRRELDACVGEIRFLERRLDRGL
jgi:hypothetical protein